MSGHNKWSKIQHKKGKADKARSSLFTKMLRAITLAAQQGGGDIDMNFSLRLAVERAKAANMPKDNIERAIKRGTGEDKEGVIFEEIVYEGFGPNGVAILIETVTDNKNRTVSEVKHLLSKYGGSMGGPGAVQWQFDHVGSILFSKDMLKEKGLDLDELSLALIDAGAADVKDHGEFVQILTAKESLKTVLDAVMEAGIEPEESGLEWMPKELLDVDDVVREKIDKLEEAFDENDDVKEMYTNI
ncbi:YebC/PmpR family DNA-binding transcriptional regulator [Patescibacteria group bacterium]|nr:YebC/PmpR family DNA-binding transcriptional regulator [Patescibacteria group bacterium]MBU1721534.1 YebC/PmpR family DNA-binding transcriptional regulator [Patescibacteria group bacterium]MBU1901500.1 YebC/PmpR family DNA-binding transcriptional regulator [Patescibacteria group bacterium]